MWSALVIYRLLDALSNKLPHEKLERSCVTCLQAVSCSIVPDTLLPPQSQLDTMYRSSATGYDPTPANISRVTIKNPDMKTFMIDFANFLHDCWIFEKVNYSYTYVHVCIYISAACSCLNCLYPSLLAISRLDIWT